MVKYTDELLALVIVSSDTRHGSTSGK